MSGRDRIVPSPHEHDDRAVSVAGLAAGFLVRGQPGFSGWKPYEPEPVSARPVSGIEVIERTVFRCQTRGCTWEEPVRFPPSKCPACSARGPTPDELVWGDYR